MIIKYCPVDGKKLFWEEWKESPIMKKAMDSFTHRKGQHYFVRHLKCLKNCAIDNIISDRFALEESEWRIHRQS